MIALDQIRIDGGTQSRAELNQDVVAEYAESYKAGAQMPPIVVFFDGNFYWLGDGFHRYFGAKAAGMETIYEERIPGTQEDAFVYCLGANHKHGLRRTNADKRHSVEMALGHPAWESLSDNEVAKRCGVSQNFVSEIHRSLKSDLSEKSTERTSILNPIEDAEVSPTVKTVTRNGKTYQQDTSNIGTKPKQPDNAVATKPMIVDGECERIEEPDATGQTELAALHEQFADQGQNLKASIEENESMGRVFDSDDKVAASMAEAKRFRELSRVLTERNNGLTNEKNEAIKWVKHWKRRAEKAEASLKKEAENAA